MYLSGLRIYKLGQMIAYGIVNLNIYSDIPKSNMGSLLTKVADQTLQQSPVQPGASAICSPSEVPALQY